MKIIKPFVELYPQEDYTLEGIYKQIEKCARVSYKSEDKITETSSKTFVDNLIKAGHYAPLEHGTVYLTITLPKKAWNKKIVDKYYRNPYSRCNNTYNDLDYIYYIVTNYRVLIENNWLEDLQYLCAPTEHHVKRYCVKFTTNIGVTRESNRHRSHSTTEMSTRYCNFSKDKFDNQLNIVPSVWIPTNCTEIQALRDSKTQMLMYANMIDNLDLEDDMSAIDFWLFSLCTADYCYNKLIEKGWKPQQARVVLPLETYTDVVYTAFEDAWRHFFGLRTSIFAKTGAPHPDMAKLADELYYKFKELNYIKMDLIDRMNNFFLYKHTSPSGKVYIGITNRDPYFRWGKDGCNYLAKTKTGKYKHSKFANAILKYGWDNIRHEILYQNLDKNTACLLEQQYIREYKSKNMCYNLTLGGEGMWGFEFSEESLEKMRISHLGKKQSSSTITKRAEKCKGKKRTCEQKKKVSKPVVQYTISGEKVAEYFGVREASRQTGINSSHIGDCCNEKPNRKTAGGFIWKWKI